MSPAPASRYEGLFQPFTFGGQMLRNRIVMAPMTRNFSPGGVPGKDVAQYYGRRASGGAGLIITEGTYIDHPAANGYPNVPAFFGRGLDGWRHVVDTVHAAGARIVPQLWHVGSVRRAGTEPDPEVMGVGPMAVEEAGSTVVRAMTGRDIDDVVKSYARAAFAAHDLGFDGVEIHGAHGYLIDQFLWAESNQRTDDYGGTLPRRMRFACEVVQAMRDAVPDDFPIIFRFSQWKMSDYSARIARTADELGIILDGLSRAGVDIFHASTRRFWEPAFDGSGETLAACTRRLSGKPVIAVGSVGLAQQHETRKLRTRENVNSDTADLNRLLIGMDQGEFDLVAVGRGMLADADWATKVRKGDVRTLNKLTEAAMNDLV